MEFSVNTSNFRMAVEAIAPFIQAHPQKVPHDVLLEIRDGAGHLAAERSGYRVVSSPFPVEGATGDVSVLVPFRGVSGIVDIDAHFATVAKPVTARMRIEERDGHRAFAYASCGATCETPVRTPAASEVPHTGTRTVLGEIDPVAFRRALELITAALDVRNLADRYTTIDFVLDDGIPAAVAATEHELVVVRGRGLIADVRVHVSTVPLLLAFLRGVSGRATVAACQAHVFITGDVGESFAFPRPTGGPRHVTAPIARSAPSDVRICADVKRLVTALRFLTHESGQAPAAAMLTPDGALVLAIRESERHHSQTSVPVSFVTEPRDVGFRFSPAPLLRLLRASESETIELRLTVVENPPARIARRLTATETSSDGALTIQRVAALLR